MGLGRSARTRALELWQKRPRWVSSTNLEFRRARHHDESWKEIATAHARSGGSERQRSTVTMRVELESDRDQRGPFPPSPPERQAWPDDSWSLSHIKLHCENRRSPFSQVMSSEHSLSMR